MRIGYARVSTPDQSFTLQRDALEQSGCSKVFQEVASGAKAARPALIAALEYMRAKPRHDLRYTSVHFSRPYPVRSNSNSTNCCAEKDLRACRRRV